MALGSSLVAHGSSWWLLAGIYKNHCFIKQSLYFSFPRAILNVSQELYSGSLKMHEDHRFVGFWIQGQKTIKSSFLGLVLSTSGAKSRKSLNRVSLGWFSRHLEPRPESHQIELPGTGFADFLSQGWKFIKPSFLGFVFSTSGAKARKS